MSVNLSPVGGVAGQFFDNNGNPLSGGKIYTYVAGSSTPAATYTSSAATNAHANPIILDAGGRVPGGEIWLTDSVSYKFTINTSVNALIGTYDNIVGVNSAFLNYTVQEEIIVATASQTVFNLGITYVPGNNSLTVFVDGVNQIVDDSYVETDGNTVTFVSGLNVGAQVKFTTAVANSSGIETDAALVIYTPAGTGAVATTVQAKLRESVSVLDFGAVGDGVADDTAAIQAAIDKVYDADGGAIYFPAGTYLVSTQLDCYQGSARRIRIHGDGQGATIINTVSNITVFYHAENFDCCDLSITQTGTAKTGRAFATPTNKQSAYCRYERLAVTGFKYGVWWRYSLWNSIRDVAFYSCGIGIKASRNALPDDQTDPTAPGSWNLDPGFFHNQDTFSNILCNGGEVGIYGAFNGCTFDNITTQNQTGDGSANTVAPVGLAGTGIYLQSGSGASSYGSRANVLLSLYSEGTRQPLYMTYATASLAGIFVQGAGTSGGAYEQPIYLSNSVLNARNVSYQSGDYFKYQLVLVNSLLYGNVTGGASATVSPYSIDATSSYYQYGGPSTINLSFTHAGVATTVVKAMTNRRNYSVKVTGIYDGATAKGASFEVLHYQSGYSTVLTTTGGSADITCTVSGGNLQINTTNALTYNLYVTVIENSVLGNTGVF